MVYVPYRQNLTDYQNFANFWIHARQDFAVRTSGNPASFTNPVRQAFAEVDPTVAAAGIAPMRESISIQAGTQEFWMRLLGIFAGLGVFLAAIGIYGILSYTVEQRTREFGIRTTFGAQSHDILRLVLREGILVTLVGLVLGVAGAFAATRLMGGLLYGVEPMDPLTIAAWRLCCSRSLWSRATFLDGARLDSIRRLPCASNKDFDPRFTVQHSAEDCVLAMPGGVFPGSVRTGGEGATGRTSKADDRPTERGSAGKERDAFGPYGPTPA